MIIHVKLMLPLDDGITSVAALLGALATAIYGHKHISSYDMTLFNRNDSY